MAEINLSDNRFLVGEKQDGSFKFELSSKDDLKVLDYLLGAYDQPPLLVIIDSLRAAVSHDKNEVKVGKVMRFVNELCCDRHGASLCYIHHCNKSVEGDPLNWVAGNTAITSAVRCVALMQKKSEFTRTISIVKSNINYPVVEFETLKLKNEIKILIPQEKSEKTKQARAEEILTGMFSEKKEIPQKECISRGESEGINEATMKKAKGELGLKSDRDDFKSPWMWKLAV